MDDLKKWIISRFTPHHTTTLPKGLFSQKLFFKSTLLLNVVSVACKYIPQRPLLSLLCLTFFFAGPHLRKPKSALSWRAPCSLNLIFFWQMCSSQESHSVYHTPRTSSCTTCPMQKNNYSGSRSGSSSDFSRVPDPAPIILNILESCKKMPYNQSKRRIKQLPSLKKNIALYFLYNYSKKEITF